jgi:hypothetical protein
LWSQAAIRRSVFAINGEDPAAQTAGWTHLEEIGLAAQLRVDREHIMWIPTEVLDLYPTEDEAKIIELLMHYNTLIQERQHLRVNATKRFGQIQDVLADLRAQVHTLDATFVFPEGDNADELVDIPTPAFRKRERELDRYRDMQEELPSRINQTSKELEGNVTRFRTEIDRLLDQVQEARRNPQGHLSTFAFATSYMQDIIAGIEHFNDLVAQRSKCPRL